MPGRREQLHRQDGGAPGQGKAAPISSLTVGEKVLATNTKTGKTEVEAVTAVMLHHDTDLYDLRSVRTAKTTIIDTTSNHLFWVPGSRGQAGGSRPAALKYGTRLRTSAGDGAAVVIGGAVPRQHDGWMWDITVPGDNDHDFYIQTANAGVLVHNCGGLLDNIKQTANDLWTKYQPTKPPCRNSNWFSAVSEAVSAISQMVFSSTRQGGRWRGTRSWASVPARSVTWVSATGSASPLASAQGHSTHWRATLSILTR